MAQPEWGTKRQCASCGAKFYDLRRNPIVCPKCEAIVEPETAPRSRATAAVAAVADAEASPVIDAKNVEVVADAKSAAPDTEAGGEAAADVAEQDGATSGLIEDASELGEDADDMAEVVAASSKDDDER